MTTFLFLPLPVFAQPANPLCYYFQPNQTLRYRVDLQHEIRMGGPSSQDLPVATQIIFQASVRMVEVDFAGNATLEAKAEKFNVKNRIGSKETVIPSPVASGQTIRFRVGPSGLLPGQEALKNSSGLPWNLLLSHAFPDLNRGRYVGPAVFNGQRCFRVEFALSREEAGNSSRGQGTGFFADGHLISATTQGKTDVGGSVSFPKEGAGPINISAKAVFSSRLSLLN